MGPIDPLYTIQGDGMPATHGHIHCSVLVNRHPHLQKILDHSYIAPMFIPATPTLTSFRPGNIAFFHISIFHYEGGIAWKCLIANTRYGGICEPTDVVNSKVGYRLISIDSDTCLKLDICRGVIIWECLPNKPVWIMLTVNDQRWG